MKALQARPQDGMLLAHDKRREEKANAFNIETKRRTR
jgi:hypothetical protein